MALTREILEEMGCEHPDHTPGTPCPDGIYLSPRCHPGMPIFANYKDGEITITCAVCRATVCAVAVR